MGILRRLFGKKQMPVNTVAGIPQQAVTDLLTLLSLEFMGEGREGAAEASNHLGDVPVNLLLAARESVQRMLQDKDPDLLPGSHRWIRRVIDHEMARREGQVATGERSPWPTGEEAADVIWYRGGRQLQAHVFDPTQASHSHSRRNQALAAFERALIINPGVAAYWIASAEVVSELGRPKEAVACYDRALAIDPQSAGTWFAKAGLLRYYLHRNEEALVAVNRALALNFSHPVTFSHACELKGVILASLGREAEALAAFDQAHAITPSAQAPLMGKAAILRKLGREAEAREVDKLLKEQPWRRSPSSG